MSVATVDGEVSSSSRLSHSPDSNLSQALEVLNRLWQGESHQKEKVTEIVLTASSLSAIQEPMNRVFSSGVAAKASGMLLC